MSRRHLCCPRFFPGSLYVILAAAMLLAGCSSFDRQWSSLAERPSAEQSGILGRWEGKWHSEVSDHEGRLRCIVSRDEPVSGGGEEPKNGDHLFRFSATWGPGIISEYDIEMTTRQETPTRTAFEGRMSLGMFGEYQCKGYIEGGTFFATYTAEKDHGTFQMQRPETNSGSK